MNPSLHKARAITNNKAIYFLYFTVLLIYVSFAYCQSFPQMQVPSTQQIEARAIWVSRWTYNSPYDIKTILNNIKEANGNIVIFQVRGQAETYYKSAYEPWAEAISKNGTDPGWDPLAVAIEEAHKLGLQLHAWVNVYPAWRGKIPPNAPNQLWYTHPDWFCYDRDGKKMALNDEYVVLNPANPEVQDYLYRIFMELVQNYDIDGLHFDYVRYYDSSYSYDSISLQRFYDQYHATPNELPEQWNNFRREQVTGLVRRTYQGMKAVKPQMMLSTSVWGDYDDGYIDYLQDSHRWLTEGIVDFICPMMYTLDNAQYTTWVKRHLANQHQRFVYPGIGAYLMKNANELLKQIEINRTVAATDKIKGTTIFDYTTLFENNQRTKFGDALISGPFAEPALAPDISVMWWKTSEKKDVVGPLIIDLKISPEIVRNGEPFSVTCRATDPSGIDENSVTLIYTIVGNNGTEKQQELKMQHIPNTPDEFITLEKVPAQTPDTELYLRVRAYDNYGTNPADHNLGDSEYAKINFYYPQGNYQQIGNFGESYTIGQFAVCDQQGKVWLTELRPARIRVFELNGTECAFSKQSVGLDVQGKEVPIFSPSGIAVDRKGTIYVSCDTAGNVMKFNAKTGKPLPGFAIPYTPGDLALDDAGHIFIVEKLHQRWHAYDAKGKEITGSPFGNVTSQATHINRGIGVTKNGKTVYIADETSGAIHKWVGSIKNNKATYEKKDDLAKVQDASGAVDIDRQGNIYVSNYGLNCIQVFDKTEKHIADLVDGNPAIMHPRGVAYTDDGKTIYIVNMDYGSQGGKLQKWIKKGTRY